MTSALTARAARRARWRAAGWVAAAGAVGAGLLAASLGVVIGSTPEDRAPLPLPIDAAVEVPDRVPLAGPMVVYGTPPDGGRPRAADLGCGLTVGGGRLSTVAAQQEDRIVVNGRGLVPLVSFPGRAGYGVACTGPAAVAAAPLYLLPGASPRHLVPLAAFSTAALLVPLGVVGLLMLRASGD